MAEGDLRSFFGGRCIKAELSQTTETGGGPSQRQGQQGDVEIARFDGISDVIDPANARLATNKLASMSALCLCLKRRVSWHTLLTDGATEAWSGRPGRNTPP